MKLLTTILISAFMIVFFGCEGYSPPEIEEVTLFTCSGEVDLDREIVVRPGEKVTIEVTAIGGHSPITYEYKISGGQIIEYGGNTIEWKALKEGIYSIDIIVSDLWDNQNQKSLQIIVQGIKGLKDIQVADLWFPGGIGSHWAYMDPPSELEVTDPIEINGKTYKRILGGEPGFLDSSPYLTFREENQRILGYAVPINQRIKSELEEKLIARGRSGKEIEIQPMSDEWVLLEMGGPEIWGHEWTIALFRIKVFGEVTSETIELIGEIMEAQTSHETLGNLEAFVISWKSTEARVEREILPFIEEIWTGWLTPGWTRMWLAPKIGLVRLEGTLDTTTLVDYELKPER